MLLMNSDTYKPGGTIEPNGELLPGEEPETEISQADLIELLQKENQELAHQLADTRYKLNQAEIDYKGLQKTVDKTIQARNWWRADYNDLLDKILDRVNRGCFDD